MKRHFKSLPYSEYDIPTYLPANKSTYQSVSYVDHNYHQREKNTFSAPKPYHPSHETQFRNYKHEQDKKYQEYKQDLHDGHYIPKEENPKKPKRKAQMMTLSDLEQKYPQNNCNGRQQIVQQQIIPMGGGGGGGLLCGFLNTMKNAYKMRAKKSHNPWEKKLYNNLTDHMDPKNPHNRP